MKADITVCTGERFSLQVEGDYLAAGNEERESGPRLGLPWVEWRVTNPSVLKMLSKPPLNAMPFAAVGAGLCDVIAFVGGASASYTVEVIDPALEIFLVR